MKALPFSQCDVIAKKYIFLKNTQTQKKKKLVNKYLSYLQVYNKIVNV